MVRIERRDTLISISSQIFLAAGDVKHFGKKWRQVDEQTPAATVPVQLCLMSMANGPQFDNFLKNCVDQARVAGVISQQLRNSNFLVGFFFFILLKKKRIHIFYSYLRLDDFKNNSYDKIRR